MIQTQTLLKVADNSGAKTVKCIGFVDTKKNANIGDCIIVSVRSLVSASNKHQKKKSVGASSGSQQKGAKKGNNSTSSGTSKSILQKGQIFKALIIRTKKGISNRSFGHKLSFLSNQVILLNSQGELVGSRIFGPITREIRAKNYDKVLSHSDRIL